MPSKEEYSKTFNNLLGTDIKWELLRKEDLVQLAFLFSNPDLLVKKVIPDVSDEKSLPLRRKLINTVLNSVSDEFVDGQGLFGKRLKNIIE